MARMSTDRAEVAVKAFTMAGCAFTEADVETVTDLDLAAQPVIRQLVYNLAERVGCSIREADGGQVVYLPDRRYKAIRDDLRKRTFDAGAKERTKRYRDRRLAEGRCPTCGREKNGEETKNCRSCLARAKRYKKQYSGESKNGCRVST